MFSAAEYKTKAKILNSNFNKLIVEERKRKIRSKIEPGNPASFWQAVDLAKKDNHRSDLPETIYHDNTALSTSDDQLDGFKVFFETKMNQQGNVISKHRLAPKKNGTANIFSQERIRKTIRGMKRKGSFGHDRIPMRVLIDSYDYLETSILDLFNKIMESNNIPEQWKISRILPLFKKGDRHKIENYRPISNLCSLAKVFEKCVLDYLTEQEIVNNIKLTSRRQYGFKPKHSTTHLALHLQQIIADALDSGKRIGVVSLDLSSAFDVVPHDILHNRLVELNLPSDVINIIDNLADRQNWIY